MGLKNLIKESKSIKVDTISSTVRLTVEINSIIEEIAEHLSISKQKIAHRMYKRRTKYSRRRT